MPLPDWQLPPGVPRGLWDYLHDAELARSYDRRLAGTPLLEQDLRFAEEQFGPPGRLLDLGCGTGRLLIPFARRGFWVVGVDLSEEMLRVAGTKAEEAGVVIHRVQANIVELEGLRDESFDYAACLFSTLGMVMGQKERQRVLRHVHRLLRPGGRFLLHVHNRWFNLRDPQGRRWLISDLVRSIMGRSEGGTRVMPAHQGIGGFPLHLFTRREVVRLLRQAGLQVREVRPVSLSENGRLRWPWCFGSLRAYGYLVAAERPA